MKSFVQVLSFDALAKICIALTGLVLIRLMSAAEYAGYVLVVSAATALTQAIVPTFNRIYILGRSGLGAHAASGAFLVLQTGVLVVALLLGSPFAVVLGSQYLLIALLALTICLTEASKTFFQRELKFVRFSMVELGRAVLFACAVALLAWQVESGMKAWQVLLIQSLAMAVVFLISSGPGLRTRRRLDLRAAWHKSLEIVRGPYSALFGYFLFLAALTQADVFLLRILADDFTLATYASAFRYYGLLMIALTAIHSVLLPRIPRVETRAELDSLLRSHRRMVAGFACIVLMGASLAGTLIPLIDGGKYPEAIPVFRILAASSVVSIIFSPYVHLVMRFQDFGFLLGLVGIATACCVVMNALLIPRFGAIGAALTTFACFGLLNAGTYYRARGVLHRFPA